MGSPEGQDAPKFTLVQGAVLGVFVAVIVAVIVAVLMPVYRSSGPAAGKVRCLSNLKQVTTAQMIYAADWDDAIGAYYTFDGAKGQSSFFDANLPYLKDPAIFLCPESSIARSDSNNCGKHVEFEHFPLILRQVGEDGIIHLDTIDAPDKVAWMHDPILKIAKVSNGEEVETNHRTWPNGFVVSFFDGHARFALTQKGGVTDPMTTDGVSLK